MPPAVSRTGFVEQAKRTVSLFSGIAMELFDSPVRKIEVVSARHVAMFIVYQKAGWSMPFVGRMFGGRDHTSVLNALRVVNLACENNDSVRAILDAIRSIAASRAAGEECDLPADARQLWEIVEDELRAARWSISRFRRSRGGVRLPSTQRRQPPFFRHAATTAGPCDTRSASVELAARLERVYGPARSTANESLREVPREASWEAEVA